MNLVKYKLELDEAGEIVLCGVGDNKVYILKNKIFRNDLLDMGF